MNDTNRHTLDMIDSQKDIQSFEKFVEEFKQKLKTVFYEREDLNDIGANRGFPPYVLREIMSTNPFSAFIPTKYGGRGGYTHEGMEMMSASGYESLSLGLIFGINWALFLQPIAKYADESVKEDVFGGFIGDKKMGGLMISEPEFGSDALNMQTSYTKNGDKYHLKGTKHWQGLTGWADYWLITAKGKDANGNLGRDIDFFVSDNNKVGQIVEVEEYYENMGLYQIPYGKNKLDLQIPEKYKLTPKTTGIGIMLDTLHRSRMMIPAMGHGFIKRMLDEAVSHCKNRFIGGKSLISYDNVQQRISRIQNAFTISSAVLNNSQRNCPTEKDLVNEGIRANTMKSIVTDLMQESSQHLFQLVGGMAFRLNHIAGRGIVDSRPFQIFEGPNEILYTQITEGVIKQMRKTKEHNLIKFLSDFNLTQKSSDYFKDLLDFKIDASLPQRKLVELGKIIGNVISMDFVIDLGQQGYNAELINSSIQTIKKEVESLISAYTSSANASIVEDYDSDSHWLKFASI